MLKEKVVLYLMIVFNIFCIIYPQYVRGKFSVTNWDDKNTDYNDKNRIRSIRIVHGIILFVLLLVSYYMFWK